MAPPQQLTRTPLPQRRAATVFLQVPVADWPAVKHGMKTEFRLAGAGLLNLQLPTPVVAYMTQRRPKRHEHALMVLEEAFREPLGAISPESLAREGFPDMAHFRRYWTMRTKTRFRPLQEVQAYRVRPWHDGDAEALGLVLVTRLYGEYMNGR